MYIKSFFHTLDDGTNIKFSIFEKWIGGERYYYAKLINVDLPDYKNLSPFEQESFFGIEATNGKQQTVYYRDPIRLERDLVSKYGIEWLESEY